MTDAERTGFSLAAIRERVDLSQIERIQRNLPAFLKADIRHLLDLVDGLLAAHEDLLGLAEGAMCEANRCCGEFDVDEELEAAQAAIKAAKGEPT